MSYKYGIGNPNNLKINVKPFLIKKFTCQYCNIQCNQYYKNSNDNCCYICYVLQNIAFHYNEIIVCKSNLTQLEIISKTYNLLIDNNVMPSVNQIDTNAKKVTLGCAELCRILRSKLFEELGLKIFFSDQFLFVNLKLDIFLFDDNFPINITDYIFTKEEVSKIKNYLNP